MVFKLVELLEITKSAMEMCLSLGLSFKQIQELEIRLEPVNPDGTTHFSLRHPKPVIPEYHSNMRH